MVASLLGYPCAVWTTELRLEPVATVSSGHRQLAGRQAMPDLGLGGCEQEGWICLTWAGEWELPRAELQEQAWSMAAASTSELSAAPAGS